VATIFFKLYAYTSYWLNAVDEHSLHSPFLFDFYTNIVKRSKHDTKIESIEKLRQKLLSDNRKVIINDLGSGSSKNPRSVSSIARTSLSSPRFSGLYKKIIDHFNSRTVLELGTSLGVNTLYLAHRQDVQVVTFEGADALADIATLTFEFARAKNIQLIQGNIDTTLPSYLQTIRKLDFVFIDANHRYEPTVSYFHQVISKITETSIVILDDIHYSTEMQKAWNEIRNHKLVYGSADLFRCGILFFDPSLNKQHVILQL
jgi:predicted O-methyltransferase YrrM